MGAPRKPVPDPRSLREALDSFPLTFFWKDRDSRYVACNELFARWAGVAGPADIVGKTDGDLPWAQGAEKYRREDREIMENGGPLYAYDELRRAPDGSTILTRRIKVALRDARGRVIGVVGVGEAIDTKDGNSAERLRNLTENAADAAVVIQDGMLVLINARGRELLGCAPGESPAIADLLLPEDRARLMEDHQKLLGGALSAPYSLYETRIVDRVGRVHWVQASTTLFPWEGRPASLHFLVDVTALRQQRQLQDALNRASAAILTAATAEDIYEAVSRELRSINVALYVFTFDPARSIILASYLGASTALVRQVERLLGVHPTTVPVSLTQFEELRRVVEDRQTLLMKDPVETMRAALPWPLRGRAAAICRILGLSRVILAPLVPRDKVFGMMALVGSDLNDSDCATVTAFALHVGAALHRTRLSQEILQENAERRRAEEESALLYAAVEQAAEHVVITDAGGTITYVNPAFERVTGWPREEVLGKNPRILQSGRQDAEFYEDLWRTLTSGKVWRGQVVNRRRDGSIFTEEATIGPVKDDHGRTVNYVAVKRDVTDSLELEERFRQAQKMEAVGRLAGGVAHDFNNILTTITGYADVLLTSLGEQDPRAGEVREILDAASRASRLTRQLLTFSRRQVTVQRLVTLNSVLQNLDSMLRPLIGEDVELVYELEPALWPVLADISQLEQVILNLSVNARDAMPHGGTLAFGTRNLPAGAPRGDGGAAADEVVLWVRDTGTGMNSEIRSHLFEPFFTTKRPGEGTGLGLATVYGVVDQSNGHIEVDSEPGKGTEFRLHFPRQAGTALQKETASARADLPRGRETILLVEDEIPVRTLTRTLLSERGYTVREAAGPGEALRLAEQEGSSIDLLLTDVVMPGMRGSELAARVKEFCGRAAILFMSGYPDDAGLGLGRRGPGVHFLEKPFTPAALARKVRETLDLAGSCGGGREPSGWSP